MEASRSDSEWMNVSQLSMKSRFLDLYSCLEPTCKVNSFVGPLLECPCCEVVGRLVRGPLRLGREGEGKELQEPQSAG